MTPENVQGVTGYRFLRLSFLWRFLLRGLAVAPAHLCGAVGRRDQLLQVLRFLLPLLLPRLDLPQLLDQVLFLCHLPEYREKRL